MAISTDSDRLLVLCDRARTALKDLKQRIETLNDLVDTLVIEHERARNLQVVLRGKSAAFSNGSDKEHFNPWIIFTDHVDRVLAQLMFMKERVHRLRVKFEGLARRTIFSLRTAEIVLAHCIGLAERGP